MKENKDQQPEIPSSIASKLEQIKLYMKTHSVTAFVGSGFSLNAKISTHVEMKTWPQLKEIFLEKLYPNNNEERNKDTNDVVKLSSLIEAQFGHNELDNILEDALPDRMVKPGYLHRKLIQLPWKDILTTNYDTLIERAALKEINDFKLVTNKETLLYRPSPRIIKLHGSFPNIRPYIMTQEDFRRYPLEHPEMVNTARQCFLESLVCMLGFSGDDPNFRAWIGWLKDVIGQKRTCPTYLITYKKDFHDADKALLFKSGIDIINLSEIKSIGSYNEAYKFFFNKLQETSEWNGKVLLEYPIDKNKTDDKINAYIRENVELMKSVRLSYPRWLILPRQHENDFWNVNENTIFWGCYYNHITDETLKLQFLYEINWRLNIAAVPCNVDWFIKAIEGFMEQMNKLKKKEYLENKEKWNKVAELGLSLIALYRYEGRNKKFDDACQTLLKYEKIPSRYVYYQQALYVLARYDKPSLKDILANWKEDTSDYQNCLQKANILHYIGDNNEALQILKRCKKSICRSLLQNKDVLYAKSCLKYVLQTMQWCRNKNTGYDNLSDFTIGESFEELICRFCEKTYKQENKQKCIQIHGFCIDSYTKKWSIRSSGFVEDYLYPYKWLMLKEQIGISMVSYSPNYTRYCLQQMFHYSWNMAWNMMMSAGDQILQDIFGREQLYLLSEEQADAYFDTYINLFETNIPLSNESIFNRLTCIDNNIRNIIPIMLGYLCTKVSQDKVLIFTKAALSKSPLLVNNALQYAYNCLDDSSLATIWELLITKEWKSPYNLIGYILPNRYTVYFQITDDIVNIITKGLNSTNNNEIYKALQIWNMANWQPNIPERYKIAIYNVIRQIRKDNHTIEALCTYDSVEVIEEEQESFKTMRNDMVNKFCETEYKYNGSSVSLTNLRDALIKANSLKNHLTEEEKKKYLLHTCDLIKIELNKQCFEKDDSTEFLGGMRWFTNQVISIYKELFLQVNLNDWSDDEYRNIATQIDWLINKGYRCLSMKTKLVLRNNQEMNDDIANLVKNALFNKEEETQKEGVEAFFVLHDNRVDVSKIVDYIFNVFMIANAAVYKELLILFANLVVKGYDKQDFNAHLLDFLNRIHEDCSNYGLNLADLCDLKYYVNYVAGALSTKIPDCHPIFNEKESGFNDVFLGYEHGRAFAQYRQSVQRQNHEHEDVTNPPPKPLQKTEQ